MNASIARKVVDIQNNSIRKIDNTRLTDGGYEYKLIYEGGFTSFISITRREIGRKKFEYFGGIAGYKFVDCIGVLKEAIRIIENKTGKEAHVI